jgi:hypothetical protein
MRNLLFPDFCLFTNNRSYLCEPRAEQVEATEVRTQYIDVALGVLLRYGRRAHARHLSKCQYRTRLNISVLTREDGLLSSLFQILKV